MNMISRLRAALAAVQLTHPDFTEAASEEVVLQMLVAFGGEQVIFPKTTQGRPGRPAVSPVLQEAARRMQVGPDELMAEAARKSGMSRATFFRLRKQRE